MDTKRNHYEQLVKEVAHCRDCDNIFATSKASSNKVTLEHDINRTEINLWSHWQGSLDAETLVIGQDWGRLPNKDEMVHWTSDKIYPSLTGKYNFPTDITLRVLFEKTFGMDISQKQDKLFFTNSVLCYKTGSLSENTSAKWYGQCNTRHMTKLLNIIRPKVIITLGKKALKGLKYCGNLTDSSNAPISLSKSLTTIVEKGPLKFSVSESGQEIIVCPVFHCGTYSNINRKLDMQLQDWGKIKRYVSF